MIKWQTDPITKGKTTWPEKGNIEYVDEISVLNEATLEITAQSTIVVKRGILVETGGILKIQPGVQFRFIPQRDYRTRVDLAQLIVNGTIIADGTETNRIWFTSNDPKPINDDWRGIMFSGAHYKSRLVNVIVEYANVGIEFADTKAVSAIAKQPHKQPQVYIKSSIVRWSTVEGIYSEHSSFTIDRCLLYQNAFHEIALEHGNYNIASSAKSVGPFRLG